MVKSYFSWSQICFSVKVPSVKKTWHWTVLCSGILAKIYDPKGFSWLTASFLRNSSGRGWLEVFCQGFWLMVKQPGVITIIGRLLLLLESTSPALMCWSASVITLAKVSTSKLIILKTRFWIMAVLGNINYYIERELLLF